MGLRNGKNAYILQAVFCNLLWGSAIPFINVGYRLFGVAGGDTGSQMLFAGCRFILAGLLTVIFRSVSLRRPAVPRGLSAWRAVGVLSLFQTVGQYFFFYVGVANTASVNHPGRQRLCVHPDRGVCFSL